MVHIVTIARFLARPEQSVGGLLRSGGCKQTVVLLPLHSADYVRRADNCQQPPETLTRMK